MFYIQRNQQIRELVGFWLLSHFCGKQVHQRYLTRKRKDPRDPTKFHPVCDICNRAYLDKKELGPYLISVAKLQKAINIRKTDCEALSSVDTEVNTTLNDTRNSSVNENDAKVVRLDMQKTTLAADVDTIKKDLKNCAAKERELNDEIFKLDRTFGEKWKSLNDMYTLVIQAKLLQ